MAISAQFTVNLYHFFSSYQLSPLQLLFMDLKVHPFGFPKRPYLLHSVQMAVTGDFLKKMSEISPPGSVSYLRFSRGFPSFSPCSPLQ